MLPNTPPQKVQFPFLELILKRTITIILFLFSGLLVLLYKGLPSLEPPLEAYPPRDEYLYPLAYTQIQFDSWEPSTFSTPGFISVFLI